MGQGHISPKAEFLRTKILAVQSTKMEQEWTDTFVWVNTGADVIVDGHDPWTPATQTRQQDADDYACPGARG